MNRKRAGPQQLRSAALGDAIARERQLGRQIRRGESRSMTTASPKGDIFQLGFATRKEAAT
jgi:hypothetical protein